jgi:hypothetical protein
MTRKVGVVALLIAFAAGSAGAIAATGGGRDRVAANRPPSASSKPLRFEAHDLYIETNATDGDAGLQLFADAEEWRSFKLRDPRGKLLVNVKAKGRARRFGLSELFVEASNRRSPSSRSAASRSASRKGDTASAAGWSMATGWSAPTLSPTWCPRGPV